MNANFPQITDAIVNSKDFFNNGADATALRTLQNLPYVAKSSSITAGATGVTVSEVFFIAPVKCQILDANFLTQSVQTGTGNTPVVKLFAGANEVGASGAIALAGAIGDVNTLVLDPTKVVVPAGTVLKVSVINPAGTITVALAGLLQIAFKAVV